MSASHIYTLPAVSTTNTPPESLRDQIERSLLGTELVVPGDTEEDKRWAYRRSVPTVVLYSEKGLRLYDGITSSAPEYYLFADELNLIKNHGHEITRAMGFPSKDKDDQSYRRHVPKDRWKPARWGDAALGKWNNGVNGEEGLASGFEPGWDIVELGAGALRKTAHFLTAVADAVPEGTNPPVTYHALDLSRPELERVLGQMDDQFGAAFSGRIASVGLHADYFAGLELVRDGGLAALSSGQRSPEISEDEPGIAMSPASTLSHDLMTPALEAAPLPPSVVGEDETITAPSETSEKLPNRYETFGSQNPFAPHAPGSDNGSDAPRPLHVMFLGSSLGNFERDEAAPFLKSIPLKQGDTILLGIDGRPAPGAEGRRKIEAAYNDPSGHTRAFEEHGWDVALEELGLPMPKTNDERTVEFVGRYNEKLGRHEAYFRSKKDQKIHLPEHNVDVDLAKDELLQIEWSYKYSVPEALDMFNKADLRVVDSWKAPDSEYRLWLLERPDVRFSGPAVERPLGPTVPTWGEWEAMWRMWDHITLDMIPPAMLHQKPIDLRHICLFYLGHIPTFLDIYLTRLLPGGPSEPTHFKDIFERGIDPDVDDPSQIHPHSEVPTRSEDWPSLEEILTFRDNVRQRLRTLYDEAEHRPLTRREARSIFMAYEHEAMHAETLLYMLLQSPLTLPPGPEPDWPVLSRHWAEAAAKAEAAHAKTIIEVSATEVTLGHYDPESEDAKSLDPEQEFGWDCEHPRRVERVAAFKADALPISNKEYLRYLGKTGRLAGLTAAAAPASWVRDGDEWAVRTVYGPVRMEYAGAWPLMASRDEIAAFAEWKGGRLPTEAELCALWESPHGPRRSGVLANTGFKNWHPVPPALTTDEHEKVHGHNGGVWEWTSTPFMPFEGYEQSTLYPGYSSDFFDGKHYTVLGGSWASAPCIADRKSFRNWYQGNYRYAWVGGRVVYDV